VRTYGYDVEQILGEKCFSVIPFCFAVKWQVKGYEYLPGYVLCQPVKGAGIGAEAMEAQYHVWPVT
jgi:hypothetical protein